MKKTKFLGLSVGNAVGKVSIQPRSLEKSQPLGVGLEGNLILFHSQAKQAKHPSSAKSKMG
jgi:hypothetical protein